ncbi:hypothetical protein FSG43_022650 [Escherichia coli]|nr:hypothetical protein [Escherichia coli]
MQVRVIVGAQAAYACINHDKGVMDIRLTPGRSARQSLQETAEEMRARAADTIRRAELIEQAAELVKQ